MKKLKTVLGGLGLSAILLFSGCGYDDTDYNNYTEGIEDRDVDIAMSVRVDDIAKTAKEVRSKAIELGGALLTENMQENYCNTTIEVPTDKADKFEESMEGYNIVERTSSVLEENEDADDDDMDKEAIEKIKFRTREDYDNYAKKQEEAKKESTTHYEIDIMPTADAMRASALTDAFSDSKELFLNLLTAILLMGMYFAPYAVIILVIVLIYRFTRKKKEKLPPIPEDKKDD